MNFYTEEAFEQAKALYKEIQDSKDDIKRLTNLTGLKKKAIKDLRKYLFFDKDKSPDLKLAKTWLQMVNSPEEASKEEEELFERILNFNLVDKNEFVDVYLISYIGSVANYKLTPSDTSLGEFIVEVDVSTGKMIYMSSNSTDITPYLGHGLQKIVSSIKKHSRLPIYKKVIWY